MSEIKIAECRCCGNRDAKQFIQKEDGYICKCCGVWFRYETGEEKDGCLAGYRQLRKYKFEDARDTFEEVLVNYPRSIDARWGLLLSRFGVVYIKGFYDDVIEPVYCFPDYEALSGRMFQNEDEYKEMRELIGADTELKYLYDAKAREIDRAIKKFRDCKESTERDVFICVKISASTEKEKHPLNERTKDYEFALRAYKDLQVRGLNVFFSFVTLKNEVNSDDLIWLNLVKSKKMLLIGSREDYLESAWVKSEWKRWRFLERQRDMYICVLNDGSDNPKNILPYELRKDAPQIYTPDTYSKLLDDICELEYTEAASPTMAAQTPIVVQSAQPIPATKARREATPLARKTLLSKIAEDEKEKSAYSAKDGKVFYRDGREEILKYGTRAIKANQYSDNTDIVKVIIPDSVTEIGDHAFSGCTGLYSVIIPDSVNFIGEWAFNFCLSLYHVTLPKKLVKINKGAFFSMDHLESIYIPDRVSTIRWEAFKGCKKLKDVYFDGAEDEWKEVSIENYNDPIETAALHFKSDEQADGKIVYADGKTEVIKYGIKKIENEAYSQNEDIVKVSLPASVTTVGDRAFFFCTNLSSVKIPNGVKTIMDCAFAGCDSLESIDIPNSVKEIGEGAFGNCEALASVNLPASLKIISDETFEGCRNLSGINIPQGVEKIGASAFNGCFNLSYISIPDSVSSIGNSAFKNCSSLTSVSIPDSVDFVWDEAFYSCGQMTSASIGCEQIGRLAFGSCGKLSSVSFSDNVKKIKERAFSGCYSLTDKNVEIPSGVSLIEWNPFWGYKVNLTVSPNNRFYKIIDGNLYTANEKELVAHMTSETETPFSIPNTVVKIGTDAFAYSGVKSVIMPNTVKEFGPGAFGSMATEAEKELGFGGYTEVDDIYFKGKKAEWESIMVAYKKGNEIRTMTIGDIIKNTTRYSTPVVLPKVHFKTLFGYTK